MAAQIVLNIDNEPGSMARVMAALRRFGLSLGKHHIQSGENGLSRLALIVDGEFSAQELIGKLNDVRGVRQVISIGSADAEVTYRSQPPATTGHSQISAIVQDIVSSFPRIANIIENYESALGKDKTRRLRMKELGETVGTKLMHNDEALKNATTIHEALQQVIVPALLPISDAEAMGSEIRTSISIFTRRQAHTLNSVAGSTARRCDFMAGLIQGMINASQTLTKVKVEEHACRNDGDDYCVFRVIT